MVRIIGTPGKYDRGWL